MSFHVTSFSLFTARASLRKVAMQNSSVDVFTPYFVADFHIVKILSIFPFIHDFFLDKLLRYYNYLSLSCPFFLEILRHGSEIKNASVCHLSKHNAGCIITARMRSAPMCTNVFRPKCSTIIPIKNKLNCKRLTKIID